MPRIHLLPPETARLIAAGEVIDRPAAVLREFLDNAIDAGASSIRVEIAGGGIELIRVADDGVGMSRKDLELAVLPHATSKIASADDLLHTRSLGFRGEALASIAAAARLEILSAEEGAPLAHRLVTGPGATTSIQAAPGRRGTLCEATRLFENFPARKQFLKRPQAEAALCRQTFIDKALAHPDLAFRYTSEGRSPLVLAPASPESRVTACYNEVPQQLVHRVRFSGEGVSGSVVLAGPAFYRADRRLMQVFVNRRRVQDPGLVQALDYAFSGFLPGGAHPCAFLFAEVDPELADFNIHPAKREVRLKDPGALRRSLVQAVQGFLGELARHAPERRALDNVASNPLAEFEWGGAANNDALGGANYGGADYDDAYYGGADYGDVARGAGEGMRPSWSWEALASFRERAAPLPRPEATRGGPEEAEGVRYLGTAFGLFLIAERGDELFLIDQHAAHERLIYDELSARPVATQELLVPEVYEPEDESEDVRIARLAPELAAAGFRLEREAGAWCLTAAPAILAGAAIKAMRELVELGAAGARDAAAAARALASCRAAVKDGDTLEPEAAQELAARALRLPEPRCPHGRPVWVRLTRDELFRMVRRIV